MLGYLGSNDLHIVEFCMDSLAHVYVDPIWLLFQKAREQDHLAESVRVLQGNLTAIIILGDSGSNDLHTEEFCMDSLAHVYVDPI